MVSNQKAWVMELSGVDELFQKLEQIPSLSESVINDRLHTFAAPLAMQTIQNRIPTSKKNKAHARMSNALTVKHDNLQFTIRPRPKFNYIKYPDLGIGTSKRKEPKHFMNSGLTAVRGRISADLNIAVDNEINKLLGG
jgi:hypothetical protein